MGYSANVVLHSISPDGIELFTIEATYPLIIHNQIMTHRAFSRNSASNRARPVEKLIDDVLDDPYIPERWPINGSGMVPKEYMDEAHYIEEARYYWELGLQNAIDTSKALASIGVHKEIASRPLIPWQWNTILITATEWGNFFNLRIDKDAQDGIHKVAEMIWQAQQNSQPQRLDYGDWHLPFIKQEDIDEIWTRTGFDTEATEDQLKIISAARCARISFLNHHGQRELDKDIDLAERLIKKGDMSPTEHQATPLPPTKRHSTSNPAPRWSGNLYGWKQFRKEIPNENRSEYARPLAYNRDESL